MLLLDLCPSITRDAAGGTLGSPSTQPLMAELHPVLRRHPASLLEHAVDGFRAPRHPSGVVRAIRDLLTL